MILQSQTEIRTKLAPMLAISRAASKVIGEPKPANLPTPLASLANQYPDVDARTVAIRAIAAGYRPDMLGRTLADLTIAEVVETVQKAVQQLRKQRK